MFKEGSNILGWSLGINGVESMKFEEKIKFTCKKILNKRNL